MYRRVQGCVKGALKDGYGDLDLPSFYHVFSPCSLRGDTILPAPTKKLVFLWGCGEYDGHVCIRRNRKIKTWRSLTLAPDVPMETF
jgi:hypothetical protein